MPQNDVQAHNEETRQAWDANASFWDARMGEGNDFHRALVWPSTERLLQLRKGERVLDIACGNGQASRAMAAAGADVTAFDFSPEMIGFARRRNPPHGPQIRYLVLDATDEAALLSLGEGAFDAAICNMALFDMADIEPVIRALPRLLRPGGRFVFSVIHPCFNSGGIAQCAEQRDIEGVIRVDYSIRVYSYLTPTVSHGLAMVGQPRPQLYFHRPLHVLLGAMFRVGFALDGLEEPAFPADYAPNRNPLSWGSNYPEIPPVMVGRVRRV
jgi:2-polyprenyl-3-methyl-5-hydroxy-6-metoxy-1,4-benzoquinol methylase